MKKILLIVACIVSVVLRAENTMSYKIVGQVSDIADGTMLYLKLVEQNSYIDSVRIENGHFEFSGSGVDRPVWALVNAKGQFLPVCDFYLENGVIRIEGGRYNAKAYGTNTNEQYSIYNDDINSYNDLLYSLRVQIVTIEGEKIKEDSLRSVFEKKEQEMKEKEMSFVKTYPDSPISLRIVSYRASKVSSKEIGVLLSYLSPELQTAPEVVKLKKYAEALAKTEPGTIASDFTLLDSEGKTFTFSSEKGHYVLLDFWASWCAPCRASFPLIASLYAKYADEQFSIIGISLDKKEDAWRKALNEEKCTWLQVCDSKGVVAEKYAVSTIPLLVLIDPEGKIVGRFDKNDLPHELIRIFGK